MMTLTQKFPEVPVDTHLVVEKATESGRTLFTMRAGLASVVAELDLAEIETLHGAIGAELRRQKHEAEAFLVRDLWRLNRG